MKIKNSYGVIPFYININGSVDYIFVSRKYSYSFSDFLLGRYSVNNYNYIIKLFKNMTSNELELIKYNSFDNLWKMFWRTQNINKSYNFYIGKLHYDLLKVGYFIDNKFISINNLIQIFYNNSKKNYTEISFPKGQQDIIISEKDNIYTGLREFVEEVGIQNHDYIVYDTVKPYIVENIINNVKYVTYYYYVNIKDINIIQKYKRDNNEIDKILIINKNNYNKYQNRINFNMKEIQNNIKNFHMAEKDIEYQAIIQKKFNFINDFINQKIKPKKDEIIYNNNIKLDYIRMYINIINYITDTNELEKKIKYYKYTIMEMQKKINKKYECYHDIIGRTFKMNYEKFCNELIEKSDI
jgi:hypothetical protein